MTFLGGSIGEAHSDVQSRNEHSTEILSLWKKERKRRTQLV